MTRLAVLELELRQKSAGRLLELRNLGDGCAIATTMAPSPGDFAHPVETRIAGEPPSVDIGTYITGLSVRQMQARSKQITCSRD